MTKNVKAPSRIAAKSWTHKAKFTSEHARVIQSKKVDIPRSAVRTPVLLGSKSQPVTLCCPDMCLGVSPAKLFFLTLTLIGHECRSLNSPEVDTAWLDIEWCNVP
jgi:hypothetical protein